MRTLKSIFSALASLALVFSCTPYDNFDAGGFEKATADAGATIVDVRTPDEFADCHLERAVNCDFQSEGFLEDMETAFDKSEPVFIYCRTGKRSAAAASLLSKAGFTVGNLKGGIESWKAAGKPVTRYEVERFVTDGGAPVDVTLIKHGTLALRCGGLWIHVDPVTKLGKETDYAAEFPKADIILITHEHGDHLDASAIAALSGEDTRIILNQSSFDKLGCGEVIGNGQSISLTDDILLEAVPAYNTTPGRERFHPRGNGNGYVLTIDGLKLYIAGDTEDIPELADLKDVDVAFLPVNQPYTMTVDQCVKAAKVIAPKVLIPYHFGETDLSGLPELLPGIDVRLRQMQ